MMTIRREESYAGMDLTPYRDIFSKPPKSAFHLTSCSEKKRDHVSPVRASFLVPQPVIEEAIGRYL
jgi:hypothetical protein